MTTTLDLLQVRAITSNFEAGVRTAGGGGFVDCPAITGLSFANKRLVVQELLTATTIDPTTVDMICVQVLDAVGRVAVAYHFEVHDPRFVGLELDATKFTGVPTTHSYAVSRCRVTRYRASTAAEVLANAEPVEQFSYVMAL